MKNPPNARLVEIRSAEFELSKAKNPMFVVSLHDVETGAFVCLDWIVLSRNAERFTQAKLRALDAPLNINHDQANKLLDRRAVVAIEFHGRTGWKVDGDAEGFNAGYLPESDWIDDPKNRTAPTDPAMFEGGSSRDDYETPF